MPKYVWEQLGAPALGTTRATLGGAKGQDLGATGEVLVRSFHGENQSSVHSGGCPRRKTVPPEWNAAQSERIHVQVGSKRKFSHSTKKAVQE